MNNNKCFLCDLLEFSKTKSIKSLFEIELLKDFEKKIFIKKNCNAYTHPNLNLTERKAKNSSERSKNLVIFGIDESNEILNGLEYNNDKQKVKNLLTLFNLDLSNKIVEIKRLERRKYDSTPRPLLVKLVDYETRTTILKKAKSLKGMFVHKNIAISPDYSKAKRFKIKLMIKARVELNKQLRDEMPNANHYFSIKNGQITMVNKQVESKNSTKPNDVFNKSINTQTERLEKRIKELTSQLTLIERENEQMNVQLNEIELKIDNVANINTISEKQFLIMLDNVMTTLQSEMVTNIHENIKNYQLKT